MLDRKREERRRRVCSASPDGGRRGGAAGAVASPDAVVILQLLAGMVAMLTGSRDASEVSGAVSRCLGFGRELFDAGDMRKSSFSKLFLTPVRAGRDGAPNAGPLSTSFRR